MRLLDVKITQYKSITDSSVVSIDPEVTVLVGQNEAGKSAFLQALEKCDSVRDAEFDETEDYPRRQLTSYTSQKTGHGDIVAELTYELSPSEVALIDTRMGKGYLKSSTFQLTYYYDGNYVTDFNLGKFDEAAWLKNHIEKSPLTSDNKAKCLASPMTYSGQKDALIAADLNEEETTWRDAFINRFKDRKWNNPIAEEAYVQVIGRKPRFLYFDDYQLLPGKVNLPALHEKIKHKRPLDNEDETTLRLFEMAGVELTDMMNSSGYENGKARLEGLGISITDEIFKYWTQNQELEVEFDIREDPKDPDPRFQNGANLYIRIKNRKHRVTVSFSQRSKGFIWFFSFIVWFKSVSRTASGKEMVLLLDEPGLNLHALAQQDFLKFIDDLSEDHQVIYSTHSPFMVQSGRLHQVRVVEDRPTEGTVVSGNINGSNAKTIFPLQAALGYTIAQNLFISGKNLLVEGPADLVYLRFFSDFLESEGRTGLDADITIVPSGGLDKLATFVALLGANELKIVVLHDWAKKDDQRLGNLIMDKLIKGKNVLNYGMFRDSAETNIPATDVEDLISQGKYLDLFNSAFKSGLGGKKATESALPAGDRIVERLSRWLKTEDITLKPTGGFNHYGPANQLASHPIKFDKATLDRFESAFKAINSSFN